MEIVNPDESLCLAAGEIKATQSVSLVDAFVAATAQLTSAVLIHKDPEFEPFERDDFFAGATVQTIHQEGITITDREHIAID